MALTVDVINNGTSGPGAPGAHKESHQNNGSDEISVAGLSGLLADAQTPLSHQHGGGDISSSVANAEDSDTVDGIHSNQIIFGDSTTKSNLNENFNSASGSGFYSGYNATGVPEANKWFELLNFRHYNAGIHYAAQLAIPHASSDLFIRTITNDTPGSWSKIWHSLNSGTWTAYTPTFNNFTGSIISVTAGYVRIGALIASGGFFQCSGTVSATAGSSYISGCPITSFGVNGEVFYMNDNSNAILGTSFWDHTNGYFGVPTFSITNQWVNWFTVSGVF